MKKKKIILSLFAIFISFVFVGYVNAKPMDRFAAEWMPEEGEPLFGFSDDVFTDFNKVAFVSNTTTNIVPPATGLRKVALGDSTASVASSLLTTHKDAYFTGNMSGANGLDDPKYIGYTLDNTSAYPRWGLFNTPYETARDLFTQLAATGHTSGLVTLGQLVVFEALNDGVLSDVLEEYKGQPIDSIAAIYTITVNVDANTENAELQALAQLNGVKFNYNPALPTENQVTTVPAQAAQLIVASGSTVRAAADGTAAYLINYRLMSAVDIPVELNSIIVVSNNTPRVFTAAEITGDTSATKIDVSVTPKNVFFDKYNDAVNDAKYNHALWIAEHSYPTLSLDDALILAGINKNELVAEVKGLFNDENYTDDWTKMTENYVYFVTQYAIWKSVGMQFDSKTLGNDIVPETGTASVTNLDKLYKYYNQDREEYTNYNQKEFTKEITINKPGDDQKPTESGDYYIYGPYSLKYGFISSDDVLVTIEDEDKTGKSITDKDGNEKSGNIASGEDFYIKVKKSAKISGVKIKAATAHAYTFEPNLSSGTSYRADIYAGVNPLLRSIVGGGTYVNLGSVSQPMDVVFNPKTGVENVAIVFVITLIAFSLGYLVLNYKNKPVELN